MSIKVTPPFLSMERLYSLPKKEILLGALIIAVALAAIAGGAYMMKVGIPDLLPTQNYVDYEFQWLLTGDRMSQLVAGSLIGGGAAIATLGICLGATYIFKQIGKHYEENEQKSINKILDNLDFRIAKLAILILMYVLGAIFITAAIAVFMNAEPISQWRDIGFKIDLTHAAFGIEFVTAGSALTALATFWVFQQFLHKQEVVEQYVIPTCNMDDTHL